MAVFFESGLDLFFRPTGQQDMGEKIMKMVIIHWSRGWPISDEAICSGLSRSNMVEASARSNESHR